MTPGPSTSTSAGITVPRSALRLGPPSGSFGGVAPGPESQRLARRDRVASPEPEEGANEVAAARRHRGEAPRPRAAHEAKEHGLGLVVHGVAREQLGVHAALGLHPAADRLVPRGTRRGLEPAVAAHLRPARRGRRPCPRACTGPARRARRARCPPAGRDRRRSPRRGTPPCARRKRWRPSGRGSRVRPSTRPTRGCRPRGPRAPRGPRFASARPRDAAPSRALSGSCLHYPHPQEAREATKSSIACRAGVA